MNGGEDALERRNMRAVPPCVAVVQDSGEARRVAELLTTEYRGRVFGADTEVC